MIRTQYRRSLLILLLVALLLLTLPMLVVLRRSQRQRSYLPAILSASKEFSVPTACILAVIRAESDFDADARSKAGAIGLMQLMPGTYAFIADELLAEPLLPDQISDPATNIRCGTAYLAYLLEKFKDLRVALAAYNAGEHRVATWLADASLTKNGILLHIPFPETEAYVAKVTRYYKNYCKKYPMEEKKHENCKRTDRRALLR